MIEQIYTYASNRTVAIYRLNDDQLLGSGCCISRDGYFLSCAHIMFDDPSSLYLLTRDQKRIKVGSIQNFYDVDVSLIKCDTNGEDFDFFSINTNVIHLDREILVLGYPSGKHYRDAYFRKTSVVSRVSIDVGENNAVSVWGIAERNTIVEGMSGGPVVDTLTRELVGIIYGFDKSLTKAQYNLQKQLTGLQTQRRDDFFIPINVVVDAIPELESLAIINRNILHMNLVNQVVDTLELLGFESQLITLDNAQDCAIYANVVLGYFSFDMLIFVYSGLEQLSKDDFERFSGMIPQYQQSIGSDFEKKCIVVECTLDSDVRTHSLTSEIEVVLAEDLFTNLIDFTDYLRNAQQQWLLDRNNISQQYIDLQARELTGEQFVAVPSVVEYLDEWIRSSEKKQLLILGKYGSGKTTILRHLFCELASRHLENRAELIPVLIRLHKARNSTIKQLVVELLDEELSASHTNYHAFSQLNDVGKLLLLFDGLDEMSQPDNMYPSHLNMRQLASYFGGSSKTILTCRLEYFIDKDDVQKLLTVSEFDVFYNHHGFDVLILEDFDRDQVKEYLSKVDSKEVASRHFDLIQSKANLFELSQRPILLNMILRSLDDLIAMDDEITIASLYKTYVHEWLDRDIMLGRTAQSLISKTERLELMREIAVEISRQGTVTVDYDILVDLMEKFFSNNRSKAAFHAHDILANSFLVRNDRDRYYQFSHKSFFEYFLAESFIAEIDDLLDSTETYRIAFGDRRLSYEVFNFMLDMGLSEESLWKLVERTRDRSFNEVGFLGGNAITALTYLGVDYTNRNFDNTVLAGSVFLGADLTGSTFRGTDLFDVGFLNTILNDVDMSNANATRADLKSGKSIYGLDIAPDGSCIAIGSYNKKVTQFYVEKKLDFRLLNKRSFVGHHGHICTLAYSPDGQYIASAGQDYDIRIWNVTSDAERGSLRGHFGDIWNVMFFDDSVLVSVSTDGQIIKWDVNRMNILQSVKSGDENWGMDIDRNNGMIATGTVGGRIRIWRYADLNPVTELDPDLGQVRTLRFIPDSNLLLSGHDDGTLLAWDYVSGTQRRIDTRKSAVKTLRASYHQDIIAVGHDDGAITMWKGSDLVFAGSIENAHSDTIGNIVFVDDVNAVVSSGHDGAVSIWSLETYQEVAKLTESFEDNHFSCRHLNLTGIQGLSLDRINHLVMQGAFVQQELDSERNTPSSL